MAPLRSAPSRSPRLRSNRFRLALARLHFGQSLLRPAKRSAAGSAARAATANATRTSGTTGKYRVTGSLERILDGIEAGLSTGLVILRRRAADPHSSDMDPARRHDRKPSLDDRDPRHKRNAARAPVGVAISKLRGFPGR